MAAFILKVKDNAKECCKVDAQSKMVALKTFFPPKNYKTKICCFWINQIFIHSYGKIKTTLASLKVENESVHTQNDMHITQGYRDSIQMRLDKPIVLIFYMFFLLDIIQKLHSF
jgi:hypothetical protein